MEILCSLKLDKDQLTELAALAALNCTISLICLALRQFGSDRLMAAVRLQHVERERVYVLT